MEPQKLKRVVIKEELVALTGNYVDAILLSQLLYWSERVKDFDLFLKQEAELEGREPDKCYFGWIYKGYAELSDETMLGLSHSNIKSHLEKLSEKGFIEIRQNKNKWDRRKEYKINLKYIQRELFLKGYSLDGYSLGLPLSEIDNAVSETGNGMSETGNGMSETDNGIAQNRQTVTEITTETTTETNNSLSSAKSDDEKIKFVEESKEILLTDFMIKNLKKIKSDIKVPDTMLKKQKWAYEFDKLLRIDKRDKHEICKIIIFATEDKFWNSNILSPKKLRQHYDTLAMQMQKKQQFQEPAENTAADETAIMLEERRRERERLMKNG